MILFCQSVLNFEVVYHTLYRDNFWYCGNQPIQEKEEAPVIQVWPQDDQYGKFPFYSKTQIKLADC